MRKFALDHVDEWFDFGDFQPKMSEISKFHQKLLSGHQIIRGDRIINAISQKRKLGSLSLTEYRGTLLLKEAYPHIQIPVFFRKKKTELKKIILHILRIVF